MAKLGEGRLVPDDGESAVRVLGDALVGDARVVAGRVAFRIRGAVAGRVVGRTERAEARRQGVGDDDVVAVAVLAGAEAELPGVDVTLGQVARGQVRLVDHQILGRTLERGVVEDVEGDRVALVFAAGDRIVDDLLFVLDLLRRRRRVVVQVRALGSVGRRGGAAPVQRVLGQRDRGAVAVGDLLAGGEIAGVPLDVGVDGFRHRAGSIRVGQHGLDQGRLVAVGDRLHHDRAGAWVFLGRAGIGRRVGRVVRITLTAEELEIGRQPVVQLGAVGRVHIVVLDLQRVDRLVVVDPAQDLPFATRLGLADLDRVDLRGGAGRSAAGRAGRNRGSGGIEGRHDPRIGVDEGLVLDVVGRTDVVEALVMRDVEGHRLGRVGDQVRDVVEEQSGLAGAGLVGDHGRRVLAAARVGDPGGKHDPEGKVVTLGLAAAERCGDRNGAGLSVERIGRGRCYLQIRGTGCLRGGRGSEESRRDQGEKGQQTKRDTGYGLQVFSETSWMLSASGPLLSWPVERWESLGGQFACVVSEKPQTKELLTGLPGLPPELARGPCSSPVFLSTYKDTNNFASVKLRSRPKVRNLR